jgi:heme-degrading monooxygenase HmoA
LSVTVVTRRRAKPGQAEALFALASRRITEMPRGRQFRQQTLLFQAVADDHLLLRVSHWDNLDAYWTAMGGLGGFGPLDALCVDAGQRYFFQRIGLYEDMGRKPEAFDCAIFQAPAGEGTAMVERMQAHKTPVVRAQPGIILHAFYRDIDDADRLFIMHGWQSSADQQNFLDGPGRVLEIDLGAQGLRVERYVVLPRVEIDRYTRRQPH